MKKFFETIATMIAIAAVTAIVMISCLEQNAQLEESNRAHCAEMMEGLNE